MMGIGGSGKVTLFNGETGQVIKTTMDTKCLMSDCPTGGGITIKDIEDGWDVKQDNKAWREFLKGFAKKPNGDATKINPKISLRSAFLQVRRATEEAKKAFLNYENYTLGLVWKEPVRKFSSLKAYRRWKKQR